MTDQRLETEIKEVFDTNHKPSPNLENRVIAALPWNAPAAKRTSRVPRLAGAFAILVAAAMVAVLAGEAMLNRLSPAGGSGEAPAYSVAAIIGNDLFIVQRRTQNVLLESGDNGRSWVSRLQFPGVYAGMQMLGDTGFVVSIEMGTQATQAMTLYRTSNGGATWTALPPTKFQVEDAYFLDATHGWAVSATIGPDTSLLYATTDGGTTWAQVGTLPMDAGVGYAYGTGDHPVTFTRDSGGNLRGWYAGSTTLFTSLDGGHSWYPVSFPVPAPVANFTGTPAQPEIDDKGGVVAIAYRDPKGGDNVTANVIYLYVSTDGGATWRDPRPAPAGFAPVGDIISVTALDSSRVWLTSQSETAGDNVQAGPAVAATADAGRQWQVFRNTPTILQMIFLDPLHGYALAVTGPTDTNEIVRTEDGGKTWSVLDVPLFPEKAG